VDFCISGTLCRARAAVLSPPRTEPCVHVPIKGAAPNRRTQPWQVLQCAETLPVSAGFAVVKLATERATSKEYAVKIMGLPEPGRPLNDYESTQARAGSQYMRAAAWCS